MVVEAGGSYIQYTSSSLYTLTLEKERKIRSGIYGVTQRELAYNSNKIEGSTISKRHTESLFENGTIFSMENEVYKSKSVELFEKAQKEYSTLCNGALMQAPSTSTLEYLIDKAESAANGVSKKHKSKENEDIER